MECYHQPPEDPSFAPKLKRGRPPVDPHLKRMERLYRVEENDKIVLRAASRCSGKSVSQMLVERVDRLWSERERSSRE